MVAGLGLAGRVGASHSVLVVTPEASDPMWVSYPGSVQRARGAGADPGPQRWLDQKHVHHREGLPLSLTRDNLTPASAPAGEGVPMATLTLRP